MKLIIEHEHWGRVYVSRETEDGHTDGECRRAELEMKQAPPLDGLAFTGLKAGEYIVIDLPD